MKTYYWILKLRAPRLLNVIAEQKHREIATLSYLESTRTAKLLLTIMKKLGRIAFPIQQIDSRETASGPQLDMASVRNDKGEVITIDILHHVLHLRGKIWETVRKSFENLPFMRDPASLNMVSAYFGMKIAREITAVVYIANYARWQKYETEKGQRENILVIPASDWSAFLAENLKGETERVIVEKKERMQDIRRKLRIFKHTLQGIVKTGLSAVLNPAKLHAEAKVSEEIKPGHDYYKNGKVMATYAMGISSDMRNDISYIHASGLKTERLALLFRYKALIPTPEEFQWMRENGVTLCSTPRMKPAVPGVPPWHPSPALKKILTHFYRKYISLYFQCRSPRVKWASWLLDHYWEMGFESAYWKDLFIANKINIVVHQIPTAENFLISLALSEVGGISVNLERSMLFDYCTYLHNPPNHVYLLTGPYSLTQIPEPSFSLCTVQVGSLNVNSDHTGIPGLENLRRQTEMIIAVFDEMPSDWFFGDSIRQLYRGLIELVEQDSRFGLLIKSKKPQVLERLPEEAKAIQGLVEKGKCLVLDWKVPVAAAAVNSDLVISVPSTAIFEGILTGKRTLLFNPMRAGCKLFYGNNGLNRRVFENSRDMQASLRNYADGRDLSIGDCGDIASFTDPFGDGKGAARIGAYLGTCLAGFDAGLGRNQTIAAANAQFIQEWGKDKITNANAYKKIPDLCPEPTADVDQSPQDEHGKRRN